MAPDSGIRSSGIHPTGPLPPGASTGGFLPGMSRDTFFGEYFRRKPFVLRDATRRLLDPPLTVAEFDGIRERMVREDPVQVVERPGEAWFVRVADLTSPRLAALSDTVRQTLDWPNVWCDAVQTLAPSGIGCHFDDSDNFVLQQEGTKRWQLSPPSGLPEDSLRRRMVGDHSVGTAYMPDDALEFVLAPGDILYLPIFWSHWGVSDGPSLSVSVALNSANALDSVLPLIAEELRSQRAWWEPLPAGPASLDTLWDSLTDPALRNRIRDALRERHRAGVAHGLSAQRTIAAGAGAGGGTATGTDAGTATEDEASGGARPSPLSLSLGGGALRELVSRPRELPKARDLLSAPTSADLWASARGEHTRHVLIRLLRLLRHRSADWAGRPDIRRTARTVIGLLAAADERELAELGRHPVLLGAVRRAEHEAAADYRQTGDEFVPQVASVLLGLAVRHPEVPAGHPLTVARSDPGGIVALLPGERWSARGELAENAAVRFEETSGVPSLRTADGTWHPAVVEPLATVPGSSLHLLERAHGWWDQAGPHGVSWHCGRPPAPTADLSARAADAVALLADRWPEALAAAEAQLLVFTQPGTPDEWLSSPPDEPASARTLAAGLVTVLARAQWRLITDLFPDPEQPLPPLESPWDGSSRSAKWVCGQIFAANTRNELNRRLLGRETGAVGVAADGERAAALVLEELSGPPPDPHGWFKAFMTTQKQGL
ncbi:JmjC domain-containing protein [Streptomyces sp. NPDC056909]|uniref:JmjC domain-containing protein n=1 Tax=Streptomyces sp. NPDC056909 TaxID=3345963 RepID=UPI0036B56071